MTVEQCPFCDRIYSLFFIDDKQRPPSTTTVVCPYEGKVVRTEISTRRYVCKELAENQGADLKQLP